MTTGRINQIINDWKLSTIKTQFDFYLTHPVVIQPIHYETNSQTVPIPLTNQSNRPLHKTHSFAQARPGHTPIKQILKFFKIHQTNSKHTPNEL